MRGKLYVDGTDAFERWGVYVVFGGWNEMISYAPLKIVATNDWQEHDGVEADLSAPQLNTKEAGVKFAYSGLFSDLAGFVEYLSSKSYHDFNATQIGRSFKLRMTQMPNLDFAKRFGTLTIKFSNDFPLKNYVYAAPVSSVPEYDDYTIDGNPLTNYGCRILKGSRAEVMKAAVVKQNLLRNISTQPGAIYDDGPVTLKSKDAKLKCLMRADSLAELWRNYDALLYDLIRPGERKLYVAEIEQAFSCFYKNASVSAFYPDGKIWLEFTLTLTFTRDFTISGGDMVLCTEDSIVITTEDGENAIDLAPVKTTPQNIR